MGLLYDVNEINRIRQEAAEAELNTPGETIGRQLTKKFGYPFNKATKARIAELKSELKARR